MTAIQSKDNARVRRWRKLLSDSSTRQNEGSVLLEGPHLVNDALARGTPLEAVLVRESASGDPAVNRIVRRSQVAPVILADRVFDAMSELESSGSIAAEIRLPKGHPDLSQVPGCVFLERIQDPGNLGTIIRSAAAFGIACIVTDTGCADPWSGKALRAAQGGHFHLEIGRSADIGGDMAQFQGTVIGTVPAGGGALHEIDLRGRIGWLFGSEGAGVSREMQGRCARLATVPMPGRTESLNVAAAAAICFYEASRQRAVAAGRTGKVCRYGA